MAKQTIPIDRTYLDYPGETLKVVVLAMNGGREDEFSFSFGSKSRLPRVPSKSIQMPEKRHFCSSTSQLECLNRSGASELVRKVIETVGIGHGGQTICRKTCFLKRPKTSRGCWTLLRGCWTLLRGFWTLLFKGTLPCLGGVSMLGFSQE